MSSTSREGILAVCGSLLGLSTIASGLRFYGRRFRGQTLKTDDWLVVPAWTQVALDILSNTTLACTKLSALFFYRRVFLLDSKQTGVRLFNIITIVTVIIVVLWYIAFEFLVGFQCGAHFTALWSPEYTKYCTISEPFLYGLSVSDFLLEVWILVLPIPSISQLRIGASKKLTIFGVLLLASIGLGASIARMVAYIRIDLSNGAYLETHKFELVLTQVFYLTMLEAGMTLVAINLPSLWLLRTSTDPINLLGGGGMQIQNEERKQIQERLVLQDLQTVKSAHTRQGDFEQ